MKQNWKLLKDLYLINHPSGLECTMSSFIINACKNIPNVSFMLDSIGNLLITKSDSKSSNYPCVIAHMDAVHDFYDERNVIRNNNIVKAYYKNGMQCGLCADDCNGVYIAIQLLRSDIKNLKVCFTVEEEIGGNGALFAGQNFEFFKDVSYFLQADRKGRDDLIIYSNGHSIASPEFINDILSIPDFKYAPEIGSFTDVGILTELLDISGVNISCGYYNEHTNKEFCNLNELHTCLLFMYRIITTLKKSYKLY